MPRLRLPAGLAPLGHRDFALYWLGHAVSNAGRWIEVTGSVWLVYELTHSPVELGILGFARAIPALVLSPIAGVVADRFDLRKLLFATQAAAMVASLCLGILVATGLAQAWHVYLQVAIQAAIMAFDAAVRQALFPRLVPRAQLVEAVTLHSIAGRGSQLVGPAVGGLAIAGLGEAAPFLLNSVTFLVLMAAVILMNAVVTHPRPVGSSFRGELWEGLGPILGTPVISGLLKLEIVFGLFQMNAVMITIMGGDVLHVGPAGLGGLLSAPAFGALVGVGALLVVGRTRRQGRFNILCTLLYTLALLAFAASREYGLSLVILATLGFFDSLATVTRQSVVQLAAPARMRGRVMANMRTVTGGVGPLAQSQSGILAGAFGAPLAVVIAAAVMALATTATARLNTALWRFSSDAVISEMP